MSRRSLEFGTNFFSWLLLIAGLASFGVMIWITVLSYSPVPWMDPWFFFYQLDRGHLSILQAIWAQHNEHRHVIPKLFILLDLYVFGGTSKFLLFTIYAAQLLNFTALFYCIRRFGAFDGVIVRSIFGIVLFCLFCPAKREDFISGWQIVYVLPLLFCTLSFIAFAISARKYPGKSSSVWILLGWLAALLSSLSLLSGFLTWPMLCLEAVLLRMPKRTLGTTLLMGISALVPYLLGLHSIAHVSALSSLEHSSQVLNFFNFMLGEGWSSLSFYLGVACAWIGLLFCCNLAYEKLIQPAETDTLQVVCVVIAFNALCSVGLTAIGRWTLGFANRYEEPVFLFWAALAILVFSFFSARGWRAAVLAFQILLVVATVAASSRISALGIESRAHGQALDLAGAALASRVLDPLAIEILNVMPSDWTFGEVKFLREKKAAIYAERPNSLIGQNIGRVYRLRSNACSGEVEGSQHIQDHSWPGISIHGWGWDLLENEPIKWIVVADERGSIVGFGAPDKRKYRAQQDRPARQEASWKAFAPDPTLGKTFWLYGVLSSDMICKLSGSSKVTVPRDLPEFATSFDRLDPLWSPGDSLPQVVGGRLTYEQNAISISSETQDTQLFFNTKADLREYSSLLVKAKFSRAGTVEFFFGRQIDGRSVEGLISSPGSWLMVRANLSLNPYWKVEAGKMIRFDPTGVSGIGAVTQIAGVWGGKTPLDIPQAIELYRLPPGQ